MITYGTSYQDSDFEYKYTWCRLDSNNQHCEETITHPTDGTYSANSTDLLDVTTQTAQTWKGTNWQLTVSVKNKQTIEDTAEEAVNFSFENPLPNVGFGDFNGETQGYDLNSTFPVNEGDNVSLKINYSDDTGAVTISNKTEDFSGDTRSSLSFKKSISVLA